MNRTFSVILSSFVSFAVGDYEILITGYVDVVCVTVRVPQQVIFKRGDQLSSEIPHSNRSVPECQEEVIFIEKYEGRWCHEFCPANFSQFRVPYLLKQ